MARQRLSGSPANDPAAAEVQPVLSAAKRLVDAVEGRSIALMLRLDLTLPQLRALIVLRHYGRANGRQLAAGLRLTPGAIVSICDQLEERGYLRRSTDSDDRRITWFELTDRGRTALTATPAVALARSRTKVLLAGLTASERDGFVKVATAFAEALESAFGSQESGA